MPDEQNAPLSAPRRPHRKTGQKPPGRPKGVPNRFTTDVRHAFALLWKGLGPQLQGWIEEAAARDPARGAQLAIQCAEYFVPKLARNETVLTAGASFSQLVLAAQRLREGKSAIATRQDATES